MLPCEDISSSDFKDDYRDFLAKFNGNFNLALNPKKTSFRRRTNLNPCETCSSDIRKKVSEIILANELK